MVNTTLLQSFKGALLPQPDARSQLAPLAATVCLNQIFHASTEDPLDF